MVMATPQTPTRLPLVRSLFRSGRPTHAVAEAHLHFDRGARVWLRHDQRETGPTENPTQEYA